MQPIVLHIGFPRTATTSLQNSLAEHPQVLYLGKTNRSQERGRIRFRSDIIYELWQYLKLATDQSPDRNQLFDYFHSELEGRSSVRSIVLSDETISKPSSRNEGYSANRIVLAQRIQNVVPEATILLSLRSQKTAIESLFVRSLRSHMSDKEMWKWWDNAINPPSGKLSPTLFERYNYLSCYQSLVDVLGKNAVSFSVFEGMLKKPENYRSNLETIFNLTTNLRLSSKKVNSSKRSLEPSLIYRVLKINPPHKYRLSNEIYNEIDELYREQNQELSRIAQLDLEQYGYF